MSWLLPDCFTNERCRRFGWLMLLVVAALWYLPGLGELPLMDRDEPRFAHAAVEMMDRGSWAVPYFNNEYRFDKPPLTYWWMALHYAIFGVHEWSARLHTVIATWLVALATMSLVKRLSDARTGLIGGLAWLVTTQVFIHGRLCVADMPMVLAVTLSMRALLELLTASSTSDAKPWSRWHTLLYVSLGFGFLAKGPVAWLVPALALVLFRFALHRQPVAWSQLRLLPGLSLALLMVGAWGIPALVETRGLFWKVGMGEHVIDRGTHAFNGRFPVPGFYLVTAIVSLFPWVAFAPQVWSAARARWDTTTKLLLSWLFAPYLIFTFYATQLPHYVMPGFPAAMALLMMMNTATVKRWRWASFVVVFWIAIGLIVFAAARSRTWPEGLAGVIDHGCSLLLLLAGFGSMLTLAIIKQSRPLQVVALCTMLVGLFELHRLSQSIRKTSAAVLVADEVRSMPASTELIGYNYTEPSLVFHTDRFWRYTGKPASLEKQLSRPGNRLVLMQRREWTLPGGLQRLMKRQHVEAPTTDDSKTVNELLAKHKDYSSRIIWVFNAARSSWAEVLIAKREEEE